MKISFRTDSKEVKSLVEQVKKQQITVGEYLQNLILEERKAEGKEPKNVRDYMDSQRNYVWETWRASNLIQSILLGIPIPEITLYRADDRNQFRKTVDGLQRLTTLYLYINNHFKLDLSKSIFPSYTIDGKQYTYTDIQGKTFSELPELFQDIILTYDVRITTINNCDEEQAEKFFVSMNAGAKPLRPAEVRKAAMGGSVRKLFTESLNSDWVLHCLAPKTAIGNTGNEIMAQAITLMYHQEAVELSKENIDKVIYSFRNGGVPEELENSMIDICNYLNEASAIWIEEKKKADEAQTVKRGKRVANYATYRFPFFNKTNIVMLIVAADKAIKNNVSVETFAEWSLTFFKTPSDYYKKGLDGKTNELGNVELRLLAIDEEIENLEKEAELDTEVNEEQEAELGNQEDTKSTAIN